ncbi:MULTISPECIES: hypothetical protein [Paraburkholderia]|uniref:Uncharacterized protein n=2 Tax=Paraburkholderia TaxID=1822464 RepID=A0A6J5KD19_9BURK|nr:MULTISPECIES: hypothetical protein [Paraburkholderia]MDR6423533.1 hypothetical protein [Paraburkholderia phenoliruptrix]WMY11377.1 hypothetical protein P3F88_32535 [Paraburkholderia phenoliruptrix]WOD17184.1 hypothetical protein RW095_15295 [Paraburkholderia kirstenboschensis]CAB4052109.1 hypothetical protein LMG9964_05795 [Paraburkholderia phenoliruptrix]
MIHDRTLALEVSERMLAINGALDDAVSLVQTRCSADELEKFKIAVGEVMYTVFEKALIPIYKEHPDLVPEGQRVSGITD